VALGAGWALLLAAVAASFGAQSRVAAALDSPSPEPHAISSAAGMLAVWLIVVGLALVGVAVLVA